MSKDFWITSSWFGLLKGAFFLCDHELIAEAGYRCGRFVSSSERVRIRDERVEVVYRQLTRVCCLVLSHGRCSIWNSSSMQNVRIVHDKP